MTGSPIDSPPRRSHRRTLLVLAGVTVGMGALAWAAVPLYDLFCRVTGYSGTPLVSESGADRVLDRTVTVRFDASTAGIPWEFRPAENTMEVRLGETNLAFYEATNLSDRPITGTATFNVSPPIIGGYFVKIDCFCFREQTLAPGESAQMPVTFYVDPAIVEDGEASDVATITLSYTFFEMEAEADAGASLAATPVGR